MWSVSIPLEVIFSLQTSLMCVCGKTLFALFNLFIPKRTVTVSDKWPCQCVCNNWKKKKRKKKAESYSILLPTFQTDSMRDGNIHYLYYLMNINLNWSKSDHHTVMLKYCACNNITVPCRLWCFCNINWNRILQTVLFLQHRHPADIWAALNGSLCVFEWVLL